MTTTAEYGVRHSDGYIERIREGEAADAYMTAAQLAAVRAEAVSGEVVKRWTVTNSTPWETAC